MVLTPFGKQVEEKLDSPDRRHFQEARELLREMRGASIRRRFASDYALILLLLAASRRGAGSIEARTALELFRQSIGNRVKAYIANELKYSPYPEENLCAVMAPELELSPVKGKKPRYRAKWTAVLPAVRSRRRELTDFNIENGLVLLNESEAVELFLDRLGERAAQKVERYSELEIEDSRLEELTSELALAAKRGAERSRETGKPGRSERQPALGEPEKTRGNRTRIPPNGSPATQPPAGRALGQQPELRLNLYENGRWLEPLRYRSTAKTQLDVIGEVLEAFESTDMVFLMGVVGSGKSVIGVRTALEMGGGVVSVPTKLLSEQYRKDYEKGKYFVRDGRRVKINVLKGRDAFVCPHQAERITRGGEDDPRLRCSNPRLPCTRPTKSRLKKLSDCQHWGFVFPDDPVFRTGKYEEFWVGNYRGVSGSFCLLQRGDCPYWQQYRGYLEADINVMNSTKWEIEAMIGRLPRSELTVVDEADAWLDGLSFKVLVSDKVIDRLRKRLGESARGSTPEPARKIGLAWNDYKAGRLDPWGLATELVAALEGAEENISLYWELKKVLHFWKQVEVRQEKERVEGEEKHRVTYILPDPEPVLSQLIEKVGGKWLFMSATSQSRRVLKRIFGIDPHFVEGEAKFPGVLVQRRTGGEERVTNQKWGKWKGKQPAGETAARQARFRRRYTEVRKQIMNETKKPGFVPVHATKYLGTFERGSFHVPEKYRELTKVNNREEGGLILSTKMDRGADLKGMRSVILLKYPIPYLGDPKLQAMKKRLGERKFWEYCEDMARREFVQQIGRTLRSPDDVVEFWSPDQRCHKMLRKCWRGKVVP